jgi:hypothetical protein
MPPKNQSELAGRSANLTIPELEVHGQQIMGFVFTLRRLWDNLQAHFSMSLKFAQIEQAREKRVGEVQSAFLPRHPRSHEQHQRQGLRDECHHSHEAMEDLDSPRFFLPARASKAVAERPDRPVLHRIRAMGSSAAQGIPVLGEQPG